MFSPFPSHHRLPSSFRSSFRVLRPHRAVFATADKHSGAGEASASIKRPLREQLVALRRDADNDSLRAAVIEYIVDRYSDEYSDDASIGSFFRDLFEHGCVSGMIADLTYYADTHTFYDRHYDEIEDLRRDVEEMHGAPLTIKGDLKNFFAWLAFEETAFRLAADLEIDL